MKIALAVVSLFTFLSISLRAGAGEIQDLRALTYADTPHCQGTMAATDKILAVGDENDLITPHVDLTNLENWSQLGKVPVSGPIIDLKIQGDVLYILTSNLIEKWSLSPLQNIGAVRLPEVNSVKGFVILGKTAVVSGPEGLLKIDLTSGRQTRRLPIAPYTTVTDLDFLNEQNLVLSVDDAAKGAFQGLVVVNIPKFQVTKWIPLRGAAAPLSLKVSGEDVYLGLFPAIWKFKRSELLGSKKVKSITRAWEFLGATGAAMVGKNFYDSNYLYTCVQSKNQFTPKVFKLSELNFK